MTESSSARVVRALTTDHHIRLAALDARPLWNGVRMGHPHLEAEACACLVELLAATLLCQSRGLFEERLQILVRGAGRAKVLVSDAWPDGMVRGMLDEAEGLQGPWVAAPGLLQVMRSGPKGEPYIGRLPLVEGGISPADRGLPAAFGADPGEPHGLVRPGHRRRGRPSGGTPAPVPPWSACRAWWRPSKASMWCPTGSGIRNSCSAGSTRARRRPSSPPRRSNTAAGAARLRCWKLSAAFQRAKLEEIFAEGRSAEVRCEYCGKAFAIHRQEVMRDAH